MRTDEPEALLSLPRRAPLRVPSRRRSRIDALAGRDEMLRRILWRTYGLALLVIAATAWSLT